MVAVVYSLAFLMVSNIKYPAFKKFEFRKRGSFTRFLLVILVIYALATIPKIALFMISLTYMLMGPVKLLLPQKDEVASTVDNVIHPPYQLYFINK